MANPNTCPHCQDERSLGDCQVTQRLHADALKKVGEDSARLDWLQEQTTGYGWIARQSTTGRGYRLCETSRSDAYPTVREAIDAAMEAK